MLEIVEKLGDYCFVGKVYIYMGIVIVLLFYIDMYLVMCGGYIYGYKYEFLYNFM